MSERQLYRKLKATSNTTPAEYIRRFRSEKAKLLLEKNKNPSNVAIEVGFSSHSYFSTCFKALFNCSPKEYQESLIEGAE